MTKYIKDKHGKFAGSVGDGRDSTPKAAPAGFVSEDGVNVYDQDGQAVDLNALYEQFEAAEKKSNALRDQYNSEYNAGKWDTNRDLAGRAEDAYSEMLRADQKFKAAARAEEQGMVTKFYTVLDADANDLLAERIQDEQGISFEEARELVDNDGAATKQEMLLEQYAIVRNHCSEEDRIEVEEALMDPARTDDATRRAFAEDTSDEDLIFRLVEKAADGDRFIQAGLSRNASYRNFFS